MSRERGQAGEALARQWLEHRGLETLEQNLHLVGAEIDLVMQDGATIVFVEVRHRQSADHGDPLESVSRQKRRHLARGAEAFLAGLDQERDGRFDVLALSGSLDEPEIEWLQDAFDLDDL